LRWPFIIYHSAPGMYGYLLNYGLGSGYSRTVYTSSYKHRGFYILNRRPAGGEKVPENCQPIDRRNHFKKGSIHFAGDVFAREEAPSEMPGSAVLSWIAGTDLGIGGWPSRLDSPS
jgi:hypothetical protein